MTDACVLLAPHAYRYRGAVYALAPGSYDPADDASVLAAIEIVRAQVAAGPPSRRFEPASGEARKARQLKRLAGTDPTQALLIATGLKKP